MVECPKTGEGDTIIMRVTNEKKKKYSYVYLQKTCNPDTDVNNCILQPILIRSYLIIIFHTT